ncbi:mucin-like glycoprotein [Trypanosoma conorhini]|uniref:Mucin-like glycoprotein n=1 Tax=Trypanosoma conorhini TaxID=83891 RepID=A0A422N107_9TRYP|nr:mucin-like glycoprotein [Trypanosoma conorhini]RNE99144.1 mucin-like glycoprotein [Trypanosoma conorhini]
MALAVRRRAVCALALLALLCGSVCGAGTEESQKTGDVNVSVEVSCPDTNGMLSWRVAGEKSSTWRECPQAVKDFGSSGGAAGSNSLCIFACSMYLEKFTTGGCSPSTTDGDTNKVVAFTMNCTAAESSALHNLSRSEDGNVSINPTEDPLGGSGGCEFSTFGQPAAEVRSEPQQTPGQQQPTDAAAASSAAQTHDGARAGNGGSTATVGGQPGGAEGGGSRGPSAEGPREVTTPSVDTAASPTQTAGDRAADGTTTTTTRSPSAGSHADISVAIATAWVRAPLLLLITAVFACAGG